MMSDDATTTTKTTKVGHPSGDWAANVTIDVDARRTMSDRFDMVVACEVASRCCEIRNYFGYSSTGTAAGARVKAVVSPRIYHSRTMEAEAIDLSGGMAEARGVELVEIGDGAVARLECGYLVVVAVVGVE